MDAEVLALNHLFVKENGISPFRQIKFPIKT